MNEQDWHRLAAEAMTGYGPAQARAVSDALWPVVEPALAQRDAEIERLHDDVNEWKSWEAKARGDLRDMEIERNALRISLREVLAKAEFAHRRLAAVEALCDRKGVRIWNSELRAALAGDQP